MCLYVHLVRPCTAHHSRHKNFSRRSSVNSQVPAFGVLLQCQKWYKWNSSTFSDCRVWWPCFSAVMNRLQLQRQCDFFIPSLSLSTDAIHDMLSDITQIGLGNVTIMAVTVEWLNACMWVWVMICTICIRAAEVPVRLCINVLMSATAMKFFSPLCIHI